MEINNNNSIESGIVLTALVGVTVVGFLKTYGYAMEATFSYARTSEIEANFEKYRKLDTNIQKAVKANIYKAIEPLKTLGISVFNERDFFTGDPGSQVEQHFYAKLISEKFEGNTKFAKFLVCTVVSTLSAQAAFLTATTPQGYSNLKHNVYEYISGITHDVSDTVCSLPIVGDLLCGNSEL